MNHLQNELSPYLLQHKNNPVDWYPWCDEAFELAKNLNKPIFLSIGYSTCHWCHVMEKETFNDPESAKILNEVFVCIKVDREERPDIDAVYMQICQMLTGSGGWPLTIIMTPNKEPFFAGTYFPKNSLHGRIGVIELAQKVKELWQNQPETIVNATKEILIKINKFENTYTISGIDDTIFDSAFNELMQSFDNQYGGFSNSIKFPIPHNLTFLLRYFQKSKKNLALQMCEKTLEFMSRGGIYDHIGYGFHRYSTDIYWLVPHFEKMLYDQALLIIAYTEAYQLTKKNDYKRIAEEVIQYVIRDIRSDKGGFYSAEDADSEGEEGKFYLWSYDEIVNNLTNPEIFIDAFGILPDGNYSENNFGKSNKNIIHRKKTNEELAKKYNLAIEEIDTYIKKSLTNLLKIRNKRIHPFKDDKILTDWNSLMISALSKAGAVFKNQNYIEFAKSAEEFISKNLITNKGELLHRFRNGKSSINATLDDYAFLIWAEIELYEATLLYQYLEKAKTLTDIMIELFNDKNNGGFFLSSKLEDPLPVKIKEVYDGAMPSGNSVALFNLIRLWKYYQLPEYKRTIEASLSFFSYKLNQNPSAYTHFLSSLLLYFAPSIEIIIVNDKKDDQIQEILNLINEYFIPNKIIFFKELNCSNKNFEFLDNYKKINNKPTIYLCSNYSCKKPTDNFEELKELLEQQL